MVLEMRLVIFIGLGAFVLASCAPAAPPVTAPPPSQTAVDAYGLPLGPTHDLIMQKCTVCHGEANFARLHLNSDEWASFIGSMNADLTDAEYHQIHDYLAATLPRTPPAAPKDRPD